MVETDQNLIQRLSEENPRFRKLHEEHVLFEKKLQEYEEMTYLSEETDLERKKIQKLKLAGKDEMELMLKNLRQ
ncbi:MAG: DUF465 domain-containing protein [Desulfuromonadales bacterium]|nr:DUF465 domain-containing protein [Desulfuromonadales bacterium]